MEVIIVAGGRGTRLSKLVSDTPKPMAPINGQPFLEIILDYLCKNNVDKVVLSVGYMHNHIVSYFGCRYKNIDIEYSIETKALDTGGAIKKALKLVKNDTCFVINGDTFFNVDLCNLESKMKSNNADIVLSLKGMQNFDRYGSVVTENNGKVVGFIEKKYNDYGCINGGIYLIKSSIFNFAKLQDRFSFEFFLEEYIDTLKIYSCEFDSYFIDIGVPDDYRRAIQYFSPQSDF